MKRLLSILAAAVLLLIPAVTAAQTTDTDNGPPPVSQTLVREGDFAFDLADALKLAEPSSEAEAEDALTGAGISPKNGWVSDYPVTPDILAELNMAVLASAEAGNIGLSPDDADKAFRALAADYGLDMKPAPETLTAENEAEQDYGEYSEPTVIENYYYTEGPPVVTYYAPPWDYWYLYSWVPYPFWWDAYWYPGYYILNDFTVVVRDRHHHHHHHRHHRD